MCHKLPNLRGLYLTSNKLNGELPSNLTGCSVIQLLSLSSNEFSGRIPRANGSMKMLEGLYLARNNLKGMTLVFVFLEQLNQVISSL